MVYFLPRSPGIGTAGAASLGLAQGRCSTQLCSSQMLKKQLGLGTVRHGIRNRFAFQHLFGHLRYTLATFTRAFFLPLPGLEDNPLDCHFDAAEIAETVDVHIGICVFFWTRHKHLFVQ